MSDLISRKALIEWLTSHFDLELDEPLEKEMIRLINDQDAVQPQGIDKDRLIEELTAQKYLNPNGSSHLNWNAAINKAVHIIKNQPTVNQQPTTDGWIPCSSEDRLTEREDEKYGIGVKDACNVHEDDYEIGCFYEAIKRLMYYEDLAEQGRLAYLPQPYKESE